MNSPGDPNDAKLALPPELQFFSVQEVSLIMGVGPRTVMKWIEEGRLPAFRLGAEQRVIRVRRQALEAFINRYTQNQTEED